MVNSIATQHGSIFVPNTLNVIRLRLYRKYCAPKMPTCALSAKVNKLNTKARISQWNNNIDQTCMLSENHNEDKVHLFFNCIYSRQIL